MTRTQGETTSDTSTAESRAGAGAPPRAAADTGTEPVSLPARPRIVPGLDVLHRKDGELQIGLDPRHALVLYDLSPMLVDLIRGLDGSRSTATLLQLARSEPGHSTEGGGGEHLRRLLTELAANGLLEDTDAPAHAMSVRSDEPALWSLMSSRPRRTTAARWAQSTVLLQGGGRISAALARMLATAGVGHIDAEAEGRVGPEDLGSGFVDGDVGSPRRHAVTELVRRTNSATRTGKIRGKNRPDLVVLTDTVVPAPEIVNELMTQRQPHLLVRVRDGVGIVGPLVYPGRSVCLQCADLQRTGFDPCWPRVASQLVGRIPRTDLCSVATAAGIAGGQILRMLDPDDDMPPAWNNTIEVDAFGTTMLTRTWTPQAACSCGAAAHLARTAAAEATASKRTASEETAETEKSAGGVS